MTEKKLSAISGQRTPLVEALYRYFVDAIVDETLLKLFGKSSGNQVTRALEIINAEVSARHMIPLKDLLEINRRYLSEVSVKDTIRD